MKNNHVSRMALVTMFCFLSLTLTYAVSTIDPEPIKEGIRTDIIGFVLTLIGLFLMFIPYLSIFGLVLCILGLILGIISRHKIKNYVFRVFAIFTGIVGVLFFGLIKLLEDIFG